MKERPILFSAPMVRAILEGRKTMTRRVVKNKCALSWLLPTGFTPEFVTNSENHLCPYGQVGDRLWVRETFGQCDRVVPHVIYRADGESPNPDFKWKPSIFMPRKYSRITLEMTNVRVERLQDISEEDAKAEGIEQIDGLWKNYLPEGILGWISIDDPRESFRTLWTSINGPESWNANPWVWVVEFKRLSI